MDGIKGLYFMYNKKNAVADFHYPKKYINGEGYHSTLNAL